MSQRVAVIGTGWVTEKHLQALARLPDVRVAAVCGRDLGKAEALAAPAQAKAYALDNLLDMLRKEALDAVLLCTPPHVHGEIERALAEHVPAVLIEKPITNDLDLARRIAETFRRAKTLAGVGFMCRYRETVARARAALQASAETPVLASGFWVGDVPPPLWWRTRSQSGGQFVEQCTHLVDLARYLLSEIDEVSAFATRGFVRELPGYDVDDAAVVNVRFESGAIGNFATGCFVRPGCASALGIGLTLQARSLQVELSSWNMNLRLLRAEGEIERLESPEPDIFAVQNAAFLRAHASGDRSLIRSSYEDAIQTLRVGLAATLSVERRRPVRPEEL
jgi:predicted dehydrogenase